MPARTLTCGECGASETIPDGDWNRAQRIAVAAWEAEHQRYAHDGKQVAGWSLDPNPMFDPDYHSPWGNDQGNLGQALTV